MRRRKKGQKRSNAKYGETPTLGSLNPHEVRAFTMSTIVAVGGRKGKRKREPKKIETGFLLSEFEQPPLV